MLPSKLHFKFHSRNRSTKICPLKPNIVHWNDKKKTQVDRKTPSAELESVFNLQKKTFWERKGAISTKQRRRTSEINFGDTVNCSRSRPAPARSLGINCRHGDYGTMEPANLPLWNISLVCTRVRRPTRDPPRRARLRR